MYPNKKHTFDPMDIVQISLSLKSSIQEAIN